MWPKVFAQLIPQLIDLLPHMRRVVPMADKFLSGRAESDAAISALADNVRTDLAHANKSSVAIRQQLTDLGTQLEAVGETATQARSAATAVGQSLVTMDREIRSLRALLVTTLIIVIVLALMLGYLLLTRAR